MIQEFTATLSDMIHTHKNNYTRFICDRVMPLGASERYDNMACQICPCTFNGKFPTCVCAYGIWLYRGLK
jgi:hypothetical protein